jgi:hypothetical protein
MRQIITIFTFLFLSSVIHAQTTISNAEAVFEGVTVTVTFDLKTDQPLGVGVELYRSEDGNTWIRCHTVTGDLENLSSGKKTIHWNMMKDGLIAGNFYYKVKVKYPPGVDIQPYKFRLYVGAGSGDSYGGYLGASLEARFLNKFAIHAGVGNGWMGNIGWAAGVKWYFWKNLYWNAMVGTVGDHVEYIDYGSERFEKQRSITGTSQLVGVHWSWGSNIRFGVNAGIGVCVGFNERLIAPAYDAGISISFGTK